LAEAAAILRWIAAWAEAFGSPPVDRCSGRSLCSSPVDRCLGRSLPQSSDGSLLGPKPSAALRRIPVPAEAAAVLLRIVDSTEVSSTLLLDRRSDRSPGGSPGSRLGPKPLPFTVRFPESGRSLGGSPVRKVRVCRSRSVFSGRQECQPELAPFPVGSSSKPKLWRFASEAPCRPRPIGFSGLDPLQDRSPSGSPLAVP
jgi:hypothetical protein